MEAVITCRGWYRHIVYGLAAIVLGGLLAVPAKAGAQEAEAFLQGLATNGINMLAEQKYTEAEREARFREIVRGGFALEAIGKFVVGRYWRDMSEAQQQEYIELFSEWLLKSYANRLGGYGSGQSLEVVKSVETDSRYGDVIVSTRVVPRDGSPAISADWRVRKFGEEYKIIDIAVEGASMVGTQRKEFESVIRKEGVEGFIDTLRKRLAELTSNTG